MDFAPTKSTSAKVPASQDLLLAKQVIQLEAESLQAMAEKLSEDFLQAIQLLLACHGKVVVTGMGKSGHIGSKIAATLASTGTPAFFVHPSELRHGDFGMLEERDVVLVISSTGETQEIKLALDPLKRLGCPIIALTGNKTSTLANLSNVVLDISVEKEACPLNLAPTSSTTAALGMGDALAIVLMTRKNFKIEDFARSHPGGGLGQQLIRVKDIMRTSIDVPIVSLDSSYGAVLEEITAKKLGFTSVCNSNKELVGVITDGDLRRASLKWNQECFHKSASEMMSNNPKTISSEALASEALKLLEKHSIADLLIINERRQPVGLIDLKDLLRAGLI